LFAPGIGSAIVADDAPTTNKINGKNLIAKRDIAEAL
jgi:hypothetical protein